MTKMKGFVESFASHHPPSGTTCRMTYVSVYLSQYSSLAYNTKLETLNPLTAGAAYIQVLIFY